MAVSSFSIILYYNYNKFFYKNQSKTQEAICQTAFDSVKNFWYNRIKKGKKEKLMDTCSVSVRLDTETKEEMLRLAEEQDLTVSQIMRRAIKQYLKENKEDQVDG